MRITIRRGFIGAALSLLLGCNAFTDIDDEYPVVIEEEEHEEMNDPDESELDDCARLILEDFPQATFTDGRCIRLDEEVESCTQQYQECVGNNAETDDPQPQEITCDEAQELVDQFSNDREGQPYTSEELLNYCLELGQSIDQRLDAETCFRLVDECEIFSG